MIIRINSVTLQVSDQDKALEFYTRKLGFEVRADQPMAPGQRWIEVAPPGAQTTIVLYKATPGMPGAASYEDAKASVGKATPMILDTDDIVATFARLKEHGVTIVDEPVHEAWGWYGTFADQDGNSFGVHQGAS